MRPIKPRIGEIILLTLALASLAMSTFYYPRLVATTHHLLKTFGFTLFNLTVFLLYFIVPRLRTKIPDERFKYYDRLMIWVFSFWFFGHLIELSNVLARLNFEHSFILAKIYGMTAIGALFLLLGDTFAHAKPGWFVALPHRGTMRHPHVWEITHANLGKWLKRAGLACLPAVILPFKCVFYASLFLASACIVVGYYYYFIYPHRLYRKLKKTGSTES